MGVIRKKSWILDHFQIFDNIALFSCFLNPKATTMETGREFWNFKSLILSDVKKEDSRVGSQTNNPGDDEGKEVALRMAGSGVSMGRSGDESG